MAATDDDLWALAFSPHLEDVGLDAVPSLQPLVGDALRRRHDGFRVSEVEDGVAVIGLLHDPGHEITLSPLVQVEHLLALGVAQTLHDDLLRRLRGDAAEVARCVFPLTGHVSVFVQVLAVDRDLAGVGIDRHPGLLGGARRPLVGGHERVGERVEDRVRGHALLTFEKVERVQQVVVHHRPSLLPGLEFFSQTNTVLADATSPYRMRRSPESTETTKPLSSASSMIPRIVSNPSGPFTFTFASRPTDFT